VNDHAPGDEQHRHESELLHAQEHKGYGDDEGEREALLDEDDVIVRDNRAELRYELDLDGRVIGEIRYRVHPGAVALVHTDVEPAYQGHGYATRLIEAALEDLRRRELRVVPICPLVAEYVRTHPELADMVTDDPMTPE
jgi:predicted GNAT family acetyltransferase